jgi:hypothetical protein
MFETLNISFDEFFSLIDSQNKSNYKQIQEELKVLKQT